MSFLRDGHGRETSQQESSPHRFSQQEFGRQAFSERELSRRGFIGVAALAGAGAALGPAVTTAAAADALAARPSRVLGSPSR
ncbi:hypothetical protein [Kitasatospora sp. NPDC017646]|uniref:hypothetical protein n=1 Tax=Kitasatospora sp. NPDC017646 TaxID=3364024 RepID=UPI0037937A6B